MQLFRQFVYLSICVALSACGTINKVQTGALEKVSAAKDDALVQVGVKNKHDLLLERIQETVALQEETKQYLERAYDALSDVSTDPNEIEAQMDTLSDTYEESESVAEHLKKQIKSVDKLAKSLFIDWRRELRQYENKNLRKKSAANLASTKKQYKAFYESMQKSYQSIEPLLSLLHDNQLYLKHNRSVAAMQGFQDEVQAAGSNIDEIIANIDTAIEQSETFADVINLH